MHSREPNGPSPAVTAMWGSVQPYSRNGWARAGNPCSWVKISDHTPLGLASAEDTGSLMVKVIGQRAWPDGDADLLGHLF